MYIFFNIDKHTLCIYFTFTFMVSLLPARIIVGMTEIKECW